MATWEDLDSESGSEKEEAEEEANVVVGLVATVTSEAEPDSDSEDENEVYAKIRKEELVESLKELVTHFEVRTNELIDLKEKYIVLIKQQESTLLVLKVSEEGLRGFDFIYKTYEEKLKYLVQKLQEKCSGKTLSEHEIALEDFIISGIGRSKVASMIYSVYKNNGKGIGFSDDKSKEISLKIVNAADMPKRKRKAQVMVPGQWMLKAHDRREIYVPHPRNEGRRKCEVWRQPIWQDHWYMNYW